MSIQLQAQSFEEVFPFHIAFGRDWRILQAGRSLSRLCSSIQPGASFKELFAPCRPERPFDFQQLEASRRTLFLIRERASDVLLRGQMISLLPDREALLFLGSPWFTETSEIRRRGLSFDDFAIHDPAVDLLQVLQSQNMALNDLQVLTQTLKHQREALRDTNERLKREQGESRKLALVAARTDNAVVLTDARGRTEWVNEGFTRLTGYSLEDVQGRTPGSLLQGPDTDSTTVAYMRERIRQGKGFSAEIVNYGKSGRKYWLAIEVQPIFDDEGRITNFMAIESDVTERRAAQQRLAIQYEVSSVLAVTDRLAEAIPQVLSTICDNLGWPLGCFWRVKDRSLQLLAAWHSPSAMLDAFVEAGRGIAFAPGVGFLGCVWERRKALWISDVTRERDFRRRAEAMESGLRGAFAFPVLVRGVVWGVAEFFSGKSEEPNEDLLKTFSAVGSQLGQYVVLREAEEGLVAANTLMKAILESANYSIIATTRDGVIQTFNAAAENLLGYRSEEMVGEATPGIIHDQAEIDSRAAELSRELGREIEPGFEALVAKAALGLTDEREWSFIRKDGTRFPVMLSVTALSNDRGDIVGYLGVASNITERKRAAEALLKAKQAAEEANRAKSEFLAVMSHEIRTPMNGILGMASLLTDTRLDSHQRELVTTMQESGEALLEIINDILDFSKMESNALALEAEDFAITELVDGVVSLLSPRSSEKRITLTAVVDPQIPPVLRGDDGRLRQILVNLAGNGVKFTDVGDVVLRVRCVSRAADRARLRFTVTDSGIGIDAKQQARLFQPFAQGDPSSQRRYGGTGLGLAISKRLVQLMDGTIGLESHPGHGSTFWFELHFALPQTASVTPFSKALQGWKVILVTAHAPTSEALTAMLGNSGAEFEAVSPSALRSDPLRGPEGKPTVVVLDSLIGAGQTRELVRLIRQASTGSSVRTLLILPPRQVGAGVQGFALDAFDGHTCRPLKTGEMLACLLAVTKTEGEPEAAPIALQTGSTEMFSNDAAPAARNRALRILVAEDHDTNRRLAMLMLKRLGYRADFVFDGREALEAVQRAPYDVVLMDCQMPFMDGYEATRAIRKSEGDPQPGQRRRLHIIAMTANAMRGDREKCFEAGMDGYISKPITLETLSQALARLTPTMAVADESQSPSVPSDVTAALQGLEDEFGAQSVAELLQSFLRDTPARLTELVRQAEAQEDPAGLARNAHALAGSASIFGLEDFRGCALDLETAAKAEAWDRCRAGIEVVRDDYVSVESVLRKLLNRLESRMP